jgi:hypothetical protein
VVDHQHDDRADDRDGPCCRCRPGDAAAADRLEDKAADKRADDAAHDVEKAPGTAPVDEGGAALLREHWGARNEINLRSAISRSFLYLSSLPSIFSAKKIGRPTGDTQRNGCVP